MLEAVLDGISCHSAQGDDQTGGGALLEDDEAICVFPHRLDDRVQSMVFVVNRNKPVGDEEDTKSLVDAVSEICFSVYGQGAVRHFQTACKFWR